MSNWTCTCTQISDMIAARLHTIDLKSACNTIAIISNSFIAMS